MGRPRVGWRGSPQLCMDTKRSLERGMGVQRVNAKETRPVGYLLFGPLGLSCPGPAASWGAPSTL